MADSTDPQREFRSPRVPPIARPGDRPRALVIGGEAGRRLIEQMLAEDFDVVTAAEGIAALDTVPLGGIDLAVLDAGASRTASPATTFTVRLPVLESPKLVPAEHGR